MIQFYSFHDKLRRIGFREFFFSTLPELSHSILQKADSRFRWFDAWAHELFAENMSSEQRGVFDKNLEVSKRIAGYAVRINDKITLGLREKRTDKDGKPYALCIDEHSDGEVFGQTTTEAERRGFLLEALEQTIPEHRADIPLGQSPRKLGPKKIDGWFVSAVTQSVIIGGYTPEEAKQIVSEIMKKHKLQRRLSWSLAYNHDEAIRRGFEHFVTLLGTEPEQARGGGIRDLQTSIEEGDVTFNLEETPERVEADAGSLLDEKSMTLLEPLLDAIHIGRPEMVRRAIDFTSKYLGVKRDDIAQRSPPDWWLEDPNRGLHSREVLMYIPYKDFIGNANQSLSTSAADAKHMFDEILDSKIVVIMKEISQEEGSGWVLMRLSQNNPAYLTSEMHLTS